MEFLVDIDSNKILRKYEMTLCKLNEEQIMTVKNITDFKYDGRFAGIDELSFKIPLHRMEPDGTMVENERYHSIKGDMLLLVRGGNTHEQSGTVKNADGVSVPANYFYIHYSKEQVADDGSIYKEIQAYSREYELAQKNIDGYSGVSRAIYTKPLAAPPADSGWTWNEAGALIDENGLEVGFLNYIERISSWKVANEGIDADILLKNRALDFNNVNVLQSLQDVQRAFGGIFRFDTINKKIYFRNVENLGTYRGMRITNKNFLKTIEKNIKSDEIKTRLYLYGRDNVSIQRQSLIGRPYIENYDFYRTREYMSQELMDALDSYDALIASKEKVYSDMLDAVQAQNVLINSKQAEIVILERELKVIQINLDAALFKGESIADLRANELAKEALIRNKLDEKKSFEDVRDGHYLEIENLSKEVDLDSFLKQSNFPEGLMIEFDTFIKEDTFHDNNYTEETLDELKKEGEKILRRISWPKLQFTTSVADFLSALEGQHMWKHFRLGDQVRLKHEELDFDFLIRMLSYSHTPDNNELTLQFSTADSIDDASIYLRDILDELKTSSISVDFSKYKWDKGEQAESMIRNYVNSNLDLAKQSIMAAEGQVAIWNERGYWGSKMNPDGSESDIRLRMTNDVIAMTKDNWNSVDIAISPETGINASLLNGIVANTATLNADQIFVGIGRGPLTDDALSDNVLKQSEQYNGIKIDQDHGFVATATDGTNEFARTTVNATEGMKIEGKVNGVWQDNFYVDTNGMLRAKNMIIDGLDSGNKVFSATPTIPYTKGDLWRVSGIAGVDFKIANVSRRTGSYLASDWTDVTDSKTYVDHIKSLTNGVALSGGYTTIDRAKVKVTHADGTYSEMNSTGFIRKSLYGADSYYVNDIYVINGSTSTPLNNNHMANESEWKAAKTIYLPDRFRGKAIEPFVVMRSYQFPFAHGRAVVGFDLHDMNMQLYVSAHNTQANNPNPYVSVRGYAMHEHGTGYERVIWYNAIDFVLIVVSN